MSIACPKSAYEKLLESNWLWRVGYRAAAVCAQNSSATDPLGWRLGPAAWSFNRFTFFEAVDKTAALGLRYIEAFEGQRLSQEIDFKMSPELSTEVTEKVRQKLNAAHVTLTSIYIHSLPGNRVGVPQGVRVLPQARHEQSSLNRRQNRWMLSRSSVTNTE